MKVTEECEVKVWAPDMFGLVGPNIEINVMYDDTKGSKDEELRSALLTAMCQKYPLQVAITFGLEEIESEVNDRLIPVSDEEGEAQGFVILEPGDSDAINHPAHYGKGTYETINVIEAWGLGFCLGNAVKYISRAGKKDLWKEIEDLEKAAWYIQRRIQKLKEAKS